jgi:hypothetical protein
LALRHVDDGRQEHAPVLELLETQEPACKLTPDADLAAQADTLDRGLHDRMMA